MNDNNAGSTGGADLELLVVGSANADLVVGVERRPAAGETVLGSDLAVHPGGKGATRPSPPPGSAPARRCSPGSATTPTAPSC